MNVDLSQKELGRRLTQVRKLKGLSQQELADSLPISRSSLTQIELGNRSLSALELQRLSQILGFSMDTFLARHFDPEESLPAEVPEGNDQNERIPVTVLKVQKVKTVLLYILERCAGKPNVGETVLYKLLYFADFNYYELFEEQLTGATYRKLPYGPVPQKLDAVIHQMIEDGHLQRIKTEYHGYRQTRYFPLVKPDLRTLTANEMVVLDKVIEQFSDWSASAISDYSHKDMPWLASREGEVINYELVFYRELPFSVRNYEEEGNAV